MEALPMCCDARSLERHADGESRWPSSRPSRSIDSGKSRQRVAVRCASIHPRALERAKGIEPSYAAWEAAVLPLNYARESTTSTLFVFRFDRHLERLILAVAGILYRDLDCNPATRANTVGHETE